MCRRPIGVFDSGIGGLTVVRALRRELPGEDILYFGETGTKFVLQLTLVGGDGNIQGFDGIFIVFEHFSLPVDDFFGLGDEIFCDTKRIIELKLETRYIVEGGVDVVFKSTHATGGTQFFRFNGVWLGLRTLSQFSGNREEVRGVTEKG